MVGLIAAAGGVMLAVLADVIAARAGASRVAAYGCGLASGAAATLGLWLALAPRPDWTVAALALLAYGAWWFTLLNLTQALESSLRVRLLAEVDAAGGHLPRVALEQRYNDAVLLRLRLGRLIAHGSIVERGERLFVASTGLKLLAGFFRAIKLMLIGQTSEFHAPLP
ncbi:MAG: hypothetical protein GC191_04875 [Azospirillum sp.]|nr:hypothetical protein [Azospirillum sp.]